MKTTLFLVGPPGAGKTTLVRAVLAGADEAARYLVPRPKWTVAGDVAAAGHYTGGTFDGADTVPYNGAADALAFWEASFRDKRLTIFDGDRFSNAAAVERVRRSAGRVACAYLFAAEADLAARRAARGSRQNESWMRGRATKASRFRALFPAADLLHLDGSMLGPDALARALADFVG